MKKVCFRIGAVVVWTVLFCSILYWPHISWKTAEPDSISVFAWGDIFDPEVIAEFEQESGIRVHLNYYASNEELIVKLRATEGAGYDVIVPSDYAVQILARERLLKKIDRSKLNFWQDLNPNLLGKFFDPDNLYSIPFEWEIFGFGIDKEFFSIHPHRPPSWRSIFDSAVIDYRIGMVNDPIEAVQYAGFYLFGFLLWANEAQIQAIRQLLIWQHKWVEVYADFRADYLLATKNCPIVLASSSYIWRTMREFPFVGFVIPEEGTFITIENVAVPASSKKDRLVYQFINFLYRKESSAMHFKTYGFFPATLNALDDMDLDPLARELMLSKKEDFEKYYFTIVTMPEETLRDIWVEVKSGG